MLRCVAGAVLACACLESAAAQPARTKQVDSASCSLTAIGAATVRTVADTITPRRRPHVRLAGIELIASGEARDAPLAALVALAGKDVILKRIGSDADRYGRTAAHVFVNQDGAERWLQADLVAKGLARVSPRVGNAACAKALFALEQAARTAKLGLWADPYYGMRQAEDPPGILKVRGRFAIVEGKVLSVRESGGTIYVNFGRRWSEDFTVTISKRNERTFSAAGLEPKTLQGRRVRIRGWIEERGGPWVDAARPEQIEVLEGK